MTLTDIEREQLLSIRVQAQQHAQPVRGVQYGDRRGIGNIAARHTSEKFVALLIDVVASQCKRREIHVICDNVSSRKMERVANFLDAHRNVRLHFTPTYSAQLNQLENGFSRIHRDVIARGITE